MQDYSYQHLQDVEWPVLFDEDWEIYHDMMDNYQFYGLNKFKLADVNIIYSLNRESYYLRKKEYA
jgi:hypothetical protein